MDTLCLVIFALVWMILGLVVGRLTKCKPKPSGRLIVIPETDEYFVAITDKPEDLSKKKGLYLKVYVKERASET